MLVNGLVLYSGKSHLVQTMFYLKDKMQEKDKTLAMSRQAKVAKEVVSSVRLLGVAIPKTDYIYYGLSRIYGIGQEKGLEICGKLTIAPKLKFGTLAEEQVMKISNYLSKMKLQGDLKREVQSNIIKEVQMNTIRGMKFKYGLPVNGGRRRCNGKTAKKLNAKWLTIK